MHNRGAAWPPTPRWTTSRLEWWTRAPARELEAAVSRIVVVDNDSTFIYMMKELLEEEGYEVATCLEGESAVECIERERPALVILDVRMEAADTGWVILDQLQKNPSTRDLPIIICSAALDDLRARQASLQDSGIAVICKPFDIEDLLCLLTETLQGSGSLRPADTWIALSPIGE